MPSTAFIIWGFFLRSPTQERPPKPGNEDCKTPPKYFQAQAVSLGGRVKFPGEKFPLCLKYDLLDSKMCLFKQRCAISRLVMHLFCLCDFQEKLSRAVYCHQCQGLFLPNLATATKQSGPVAKLSEIKRVEKSVWSESSEETLWIYKDLINCWMTEENIPEKAENALFWHRIIYN